MKNSHHVTFYLEDPNHTLMFRKQGSGIGWHRTSRGLSPLHMISNPNQTPNVIYPSYGTPYNTTESLKILKSYTFWNLWGRRLQIFWSPSIGEHYHTRKEGRHREGEAFEQGRGGNHDESENSLIICGLTQKASDVEDGSTALNLQEREASSEIHQFQGAESTDIQQSPLAWSSALEAWL